MKKSALIFLLVAAFSSAAVVMVELGVRSAVLSPFILLDSQKEEGVHKMLTGYSIYQGDYLLDIQKNDAAKTDDQPLVFHIGDTSYKFSEIHSKDVALPAGDELTVMTRRGIDAVFSHDTTIQSSDRKFFFNEYTILAPENSGLFSFHLKPEFSKPLIFLMYVGSFLLPCLLALFFNHVLSMRNLFTLFFPFILAGILPLILNYHFTMGYALLLTGSYIWSILLCIFVPSFLSVALTTAVYQYTVKSDEEEDFAGNQETGFLHFTKRESVGISLLIAGGLAYFFTFFLLPMSLYVKITDRWYYFIAWYLSLTLIIMVVYTVLHRFMGNYNNVGLTEPFANLKNTIEQVCRTKVNLFMKKDSRHETNAWVYSAPFTSKKGINIYMTEGLMKNFTLDEIKAVLFHEIGHIKLKHGRWILAITFGVAVAISLIMFFTRKIMLGFGWWHYIAIFPIGVVVLILLTEWLPNKISKMFEHQADEYAVRQSGDKDLYIQTLMKLNKITEKEDGEFASKRKEWKETHPSFQKRINFIKDLT